VVIEVDPKDEAFELDASRHSVADQTSQLAKTKDDQCDMSTGTVIVRNMLRVRCAVRKTAPDWNNPAAVD
jgi:hypothetical protein